MIGMPKPRPPYLIKRISRHGKTGWYVWRRPGPQIRVRGDYGSDEFMASYHAIVAGTAPEAIEKPRHAPESLSWLIARYRETSAWSQLKESTQRARGNILKNIEKKVGDKPYTTITKADIAATRDVKRATPSAANEFINVMRNLFDWAQEAGLVDINPASGVKSVQRPRNGGFKQWTEEEIEQFENYWQIGTRERLAMSVLLYTGLRRGDAARLGKQHIRNGIIQLPTEKTGTFVTIPLLPILKKIIDASPVGDLTIITSNTGKPFVKEAFGNWFRGVCNAAGVSGSAHGLRKSGANRMAEAGATIHQLNAIFGWSGSRMASLYTERADRAKLAKEAIAKLAKKRTK